jgi:RimJ/RimL family protein N-acetyltransferase
VELLPYGEADLALTERLETDPETMRHLGGPASADQIPAIHRRRMDSAGDGWWFKIVPEPGGLPAGTIGIWDNEHGNHRIHETGWTVVPEFRGRGIASQALELLISRARADGSFDAIHAFPAVTNKPSNALCRKFDFELVGDEEFNFRGHQLHCNHWVLALSHG